jgi:hypothetical protein
MQHALLSYTSGLDHSNFFLVKCICYEAHYVYFFSLLAFHSSMVHIFSSAPCSKKYFQPMFFP